MFQEESNTLCGYLPPEYIDNLDPTGAYEGNQIKFWFVVYLDDWI